MASMCSTLSLRESSKNVRGSMDIKGEKDFNG